MKKLATISILTMLTLGIMQGMAYSEEVMIDFETFPEGYGDPEDEAAISTQYKASYGISFALDGDSNINTSDDRTDPRIEGSALTGRDEYLTFGFKYDLTGQFDVPASGYESDMGKFFLKLENLSAEGANLLVILDKPANFISGRIWDIDGPLANQSRFEQWKITAYTQEQGSDTYQELASMISPKGVDYTQSGTLDGQPYTWKFDSTDPDSEKSEDIYESYDSQYTYDRQYNGSVQGKDIYAVRMSFIGQKPTNVGLAFDQLLVSFKEPDPEADLAIEKSDNVDPVVAGSALTYTIKVSNLGPADAQNVVVTDTLPTEVTYVSGPDSCVENPVGTLTCSLGDLAAKTSTNFDITVTVKADTPASVIVNTATVDSETQDSNPNNNSDDEPTTVTVPGPDPEADLTIEKSDNVDPVVAGNALTYTIKVSNLGPADAQNVVVTDTLPAEVTYVSDTGSCGEYPIGTLTCSLGNLAANASTSFDVTVTVKSDTPAGEILNTATVSSETPDSNLNNNHDDEPTIVIEPGPGPGPDPDPAPVPEPGTLVLLGLGLAGFLALRRRQKR